MNAVLLALVVSAAPDVEPTRQDLVFFNARMAVREKKPALALKLWLLRNSLVDLGYPTSHDAEFQSVVWAATGQLTLCQDGFPRDDDGAGLWPVALHNSLLNTSDADDMPSPYEAFDVGRQQRLVSLSDVLDDEELEAVSFSRTFCIGSRLALFESNLDVLADLDDRLVWSELVRRTLRRSLKTIDRTQVTSVAAIEARLFDLELAVTELRNRRKREIASEKNADVRGANMSAAAGKAAGKRAAASLDEPANVAFLQHTLTWAPAEWLTLSRARREFLFENARRRATDEAARDALTVGIIDALVERGSGAEAQAFIGFVDAKARREVTEGARGERLLSLAESSGFKERSVISLHRGVAHLERGELAEALRSFAFALKHAEASSDTGTVHSLSRRWLSYVLSRSQTNADVLTTLKALVPRQDYNPIIEDLVWAAALRADATSFDRLVESAQKGTAFDDRMEKLSPLAHGKPGVVVTQLKATAVEAPFESLRFCKLLIATLEREQADVRAANRALLTQLLPMLEAIAGDPAAAKTIERLAHELAGRTQSLLESLGVLTPGGEGRAMSLGHSAFAGALRLAPADPLPWPFVPPMTEPPNAFSPLNLEPIEWRNAEGALVFGWRISE